MAAIEEQKTVHNSALLLRLVYCGAAVEEPQKGRSRRGFSTAALFYCGGRTSQNFAAMGALLYDAFYFVYLSGDNLINLQLLYPEFYKVNVLNK